MEGFFFAKEKCGFFLIMRMQRRHNYCKKEGDYLTKEKGVNLSLSPLPPSQNVGDSLASNLRFF